LKEADILFEFAPVPGATGGISVAMVRPDGVFKMEKSEKKVTTGTYAGIVVPVLQVVGVEAGRGRSTEKIATYHTIVTGDNPQDDWGDRYRARFTLSENKLESDGIPSNFTTCILIERNEGQEFICAPYINVKPDLKTSRDALLD
jgi:hypothetical protein